MTRVSDDDELLACEICGKTNNGSNYYHADLNELGGSWVVACNDHSEDEAIAFAARKARESLEKVNPEEAGLDSFNRHQIIV